MNMRKSRSRIKVFEYLDEVICKYRTVLVVIVRTLESEFVYKYTNI